MRLFEGNLCLKNRGENKRKRNVVCILFIICRSQPLPRKQTDGEIIVWFSHVALYDWFKKYHYFIIYMFQSERLKVLDAVNSLNWVKDVSRRSYKNNKIHYDRVKLKICRNSNFLLLQINLYFRFYTPKNIFKQVLS